MTFEAYFIKVARYMPYTIDVTNKYIIHIVHQAYTVKTMPVS